MRFKWGCEPTMKPGAVWVVEVIFFILVIWCISILLFSVVAGFSEFSERTGIVDVRHLALVQNRLPFYPRAP
jgi:hypothetical protein